ncbi:MAG: hypothetical protein F6K41_23955 [Symploca sp. SIO3E6]|nr:hypothetical protein [Caldora sp. SIO3E6]
MKNQVIDVSGLSPRQIAIIEEIVTTFKLVSQPNNLSPKILKIDHSGNSLNLAERIKQRFTHLDNVEISPITRDRMRTPPQFD